jgi:hypothetical protein
MSGYNSGAFKAKPDVAGNGIVNPLGVIRVGGNTFMNISGSDMLSTGGSFAVQCGLYAALLASAAFRWPSGHFTSISKDTLR